MATAKTTCFALFCVGILLSTRADSLPRYELVDLGLGAGVASYAVDVNDRGEAIGITSTNDVQIGFLWKNGALTLLTGFEGQAVPTDINNLGVIVGSSHSNGVSRAWQWVDGRNVDLTRGNTNESTAKAINDLGEAVGLLSVPSWYPLVFLFSDPPVQLTPDFAIAANIDDSAIISAHAINNNDYVAGQFFGQATIHTNLAPKGQPLGWGDGKMPLQSDLLALNSSNVAAGYVREYTTWNQPAIWASNVWTILPSPVSRAGTAAAINDAAIVVGKLSDPDVAMIWKNGGGTDLNALANLPAGARLVSAVAVNNAGLIAANVEENGVVRAVLLRPMADGTIPSIQITGVTNPVIHTNRVDVSLSSDASNLSAGEVVYTLYVRTRYESWYLNSHRFYYLTMAVKTNTASIAAPQSSWTDLGPGTYTISAEVHDTNGFAFYATPVSFVVTGPAELSAYRVNWAGQFEFGANASAGQEYRLEASSDLVNWLPVTNIFVAGQMAAPVANESARFYRTVMSREGLNIGEDLTTRPPIAPATIAGRSLSLPWPDQRALRVKFEADGSFSGSDNYYIAYAGTYRYWAQNGYARIEIEDPHPPAVKAVFELEFPVGTLAANAESYYGAARGRVSEGETTSDVNGFFAWFLML